MSEFTDRMNTRRETEKMKAEVLSGLLDELIEGAPEEMAADFRITRAYRNVCERASDLAEETTLDHSEDYPLEAKKEVLEYLTMVADGIKNYTECVKEQLKNSKPELN